MMTITERSLFLGGRHTYLTLNNSSYMDEVWHLPARITVDDYLERITNQVTTGLLRPVIMW